MEAGRREGGPHLQRRGDRPRWDLHATMDEELLAAVPQGQPAGIGLLALASALTPPESPWLHHIYITLAAEYNTGSKGITLITSKGSKGITLITSQVDRLS